MKLITYRGNWADEITVTGWSLQTEKQWKKYLETFEQVFKEEDEYSFGIGSNEQVEYDSFPEFKKAFQVKEISEEEAKVLIKHFGKFYGFFPEY